MPHSAAEYPRWSSVNDLTAGDVIVLKDGLIGTVSEVDIKGNKLTVIHGTTGGKEHGYYLSDITTGSYDTYPDDDALAEATVLVLARVPWSSGRS